MSNIPLYIEDFFYNIKKDNLGNICNFRTVKLYGIIMAYDIASLINTILQNRTKLKSHKYNAVNFKNTTILLLPYICDNKYIFCYIYVPFHCRQYNNTLSLEKDDYLYCIIASYEERRDLLRYYGCYNSSDVLLPSKIWKLKNENKYVVINETQGEATLVFILSFRHGVNNYPFVRELFNKIHEDYNLL